MIFPLMVICTLSIVTAFRTVSSHCPTRGRKLIPLTASLIDRRTGSSVSPRTMTSASKPVADTKWIALSQEGADLRPDLSLLTGQCFNWRQLKVSDSHATELMWIGLLQDVPIAIKYAHKGNITSYGYLDNPSSRVQQTRNRNVRTTFQLHEKLPVLYGEWSQGCERMESVVQYMPGVRVLRQDAWECLISFICSSNNNIKRITLMLDRLRHRYGKYVCSVRYDEASDQWNVYRDDSVQKTQFTNEKVLDSIKSPSTIKASRRNPIPNPSPNPNHGSSRGASAKKRSYSDAIEDLENDNDDERDVGDDVDGTRDEKTHHLFSFPSIDAVANASEGDLRELGFGYRAKFVINSAKLIRERGGMSWLESLRGRGYMHSMTSAGDSDGDGSPLPGSKIVNHSDTRLNTQETYIKSEPGIGSPVATRLGGTESMPLHNGLVKEEGVVFKHENDRLVSGETLTQRENRFWVREQLLALPGVGRKVADCVALFSLDQPAAIPVDTHVWDIVQRDYKDDLQRCIAFNQHTDAKEKFEKRRKLAMIKLESKKATKQEIKAKIHGDVLDATTPIKSERGSVAKLDVFTPEIPYSDDFEATTPSSTPKTLTPLVYEAVGDVFRRRFGSKAGWAHTVLFAAELPDFRVNLPDYMQTEMKEFEMEKRAEKERVKKEGQAKSANSMKGNGHDNDGDEAVGPSPAAKAKAKAKAKSNAKSNDTPTKTINGKYDESKSPSKMASKGTPSTSQRSRVTGTSRSEGQKGPVPKQTSVKKQKKAGKAEK